MSNRNFDSNLIIQRQRDLNDANDFYKTQKEGHTIISHPQNTDTSLQRILNFKTGSQTFYFKNEIGGGHTVSLGAIANLLGDKKEEIIIIPPSPPLFLNATIISPSQVSIEFVPGNPGNSEIVNYQYSFDNWRTEIYFNPPVTSSPVIISGLEIGKTYVISLRALSKLTYSKSSSVTVLIAIAPQTAPTLQSVIEQDKSVSIFIQAPSNTGGAPIIGYEYSTDNITYSNANAVINNNVANIIISGLTNGTQYTIYVRAKNEKGVSPTLQITATPSTIPTSLTNLIGTSSNQSITLNWGLPSNTGGAPIIEYQIYRNNTLIATVSGTTFTYNSTGLVNGSSYEFYIISRNKNGVSLQSNKVTVIPSTTPDTPTITYIVANNTSAHVYFTDGASNGGSTITSYQYTLNNGVTFTDLGSSQLLSPLTISGLTNGTLVAIKIRAVNIKGPSVNWSNNLSVTPSASTTQSAWIIINPNNLVSYGGNNSTDVKNIGTDSMITGTLSSTPAGAPTVGYITDTISGRKVFDFDGTSYITFNTGTDFGNTFTVTAWIYPRDKNSTNMLFTNANSGNSQPGFKMGWNTSGTNNKEIAFEGVNISGTRIVNVSLQNTIVLDTWQHVAYVFNKINNIMLFYKNGTPVSMTSITTSSNIPTVSSTFMIGGATNFNNLMNARLGYLRVFNTELNAANVFADFNGSRSQFKV